MWTWLIFVANSTRRKVKRRITRSIGQRAPKRPNSADVVLNMTLGRRFHLSTPTRAGMTALAAEREALFFEEGEMEMLGNLSWRWGLSHRVDYDDPRGGCCDDGFRGGESAVGNFNCIATDFVSLPKLLAIHCMGS